MKLSIAERDFLNALSLYLATRKTALRSAMQFRAPLSAEAAEDLRIHYSNYFISLMSATDLLIEEPSMNGASFRQALQIALGALSVPCSAANYLYVRELRNAIVHRGLNIASAAHFAGNFPLLVAPNPMTNRGGDQKYSAFGFYLFEIVLGCEAVVGPTIKIHLDSSGILKKKPDEAAWAEETRQSIQSCKVMPDWAKRMVPESLRTVDWNEMHQGNIAKLVELLAPFSFLPFSKAHADGRA